MQTEEDDISITSKKKNDKGQALNDAVAANSDKNDKKLEKCDGEDPKPRIVLTFRSEKSGAKSANMKIVPNEEKHEEFSPRRSSRTRGKWEWTDEADTSISPKKDKNSSQSMSENDETSDSSHTAPKRSTRRRSKDSSDNVLANAIARKEKSYNETQAPTQRLSRRIKPTAKILANEELRIGLESQNNARLGIQLERIDEGVRTRRSAKGTVVQPEVVLPQTSTPIKKEVKNVKADDEEEEDEEEVEDAKSASEGEEGSNQSVMKLKHLCELGLKAINNDTLDEEDTEDMEVEDEEDLEDEEDETLEDDEIDDDSEEVISKLLEADEDSSEDFNCIVESSKGSRPRRSTRLCSSYGGLDLETNSPILGDEEKETRRSSRRSTRYSTYESDREYRPPKKRNRSSRRDEIQEVIEVDQEDSSSRSRRNKNRFTRGEEVQSEPEQEENISETPTGADEGEQAACPEDESAIVATCFCTATSNVYAAPSELTEPVFCQAIESVDGVRVGCSHRARASQPLLRAGPRAPLVLACRLHAAQLAAHMCCPACGLYCSQGIFYQCSLGHLFHLECGLPYNETKSRPGCPHCGVRSYRWQPVNRECVRVRVQMNCSNKRIFLPDQREQCTQAYLSFSSQATPLDDSPLIPEDLLPTLPVDIKRLCEEAKTDTLEDDDGRSPAQRLCDAILDYKGIEQLIPLIVPHPGVVNEPLRSSGGGTSLHVASARGHVAAVYALHYAGADLDAADSSLRTPLLLAVQTLLEKSEVKSNIKSKKSLDKEVKDDSETEPKEEVEDKSETKDEIEEEKDSSSDKKEEKEIAKASDEDLMKVIRYLIAAGCDVNFQGPEGMTALHLAAQHGSVEVCTALLEAGGAAADARDLGGWTPLVWAAENSHHHIVRLLLSRGADADTRDNEGNGAVHWCAAAGTHHTLRLLLDAAPHAAVAANQHADTPLHVAAREGHYACVVMLLARGARTDLENSAGQLPVEVCSGASQAAISLNMQMTLATQEHIPRHKIIDNDLSNGLEPFPVQCINEVDDAPRPEFTYVREHVLPEPVQVDDCLPTMQGCSCKDGICDETCSCVVLSVKRWYTTGGRLLPNFPYHDPPMMFECNQTCACNKNKCSNMVVTKLRSRGSIGIRVSVFRTRLRGWGLRAVTDVRRGALVALYCGELLPLARADTRADDQYMFAIDVKPDLLEQCPDKTLLCVDARSYGSAARFVNHSCRANLAPVRVFAAARDLRLPVIALFAVADVRAGDELTFDYGDKFWSVKSKWMKCECGTPECRYPEKSADSDAE